MAVRSTILARSLIKAKDLKVSDSHTLEVIKAAGGRRWADLWLFPESTVHRMLMRGDTEKARQMGFGISKGCEAKDLIARCSRE